MERNIMNTLPKLSLSFLALCVSPMVIAANLNAVDIAALPGDKVEIKLTFDEPVAVPKGYTIDQPARIALDLPGVKNKLGSRNREIGIGNARNLNIIESQDRTRLVINLTSATGYNTRAEGNNLFVTMGEGVKGSSQAPSTTLPMTKPAAVQTAGISNLDFQRGEKGEGNIIIDLTGSDITPDIQDRGGKIEVNFKKAELPDALRVRLDVKDFATPVNYILAAQKGAGASITIEPTGFYDYLAYQSGNQLVISVKELTQEQKEKQTAERFAYTGEKLSLNFQDIDVRSVLQLIADFTDLNLVASDTVQGNITLRLQNVPWDQALELVLKTKGLDSRKVGNVLLVAPADEIAARERQELESRKQVAELAPLRRELIQVNYAKAGDIAGLFRSVKGDKAKEERGSITVDDRTNSIIAYQTQEQLDELRRIVAQLDIPVRQVMIEARIVEASVNFNREIGVQWKGAMVGDSKYNFSGKGGNRTGDGTKPSNPADVGGTFVDMGGAAKNGFGIGFITKNTVLDLELSAMEAAGHGEIVSQPKVVTSDKETAKITRGKEVPYQEASSSGATSTSFKEAALSLEVTPQITPDNRILMEVKVNNDDVDEANAKDGVPGIKKNEVTSKVLVADGETVVIGGVFKNEQQRKTEKVPLLGDIPGLGRLFKYTNIKDEKTELLIFITPRIMDTKAVSIQ